MEQILTISLVSASGLLGAGVGLTWARRELYKKRTDHRMSQALRRGLANPNGERQRGLQVLQWQSCESTSVR
jgi:hypothetical protein